jgi:hypothetical protein
MDLVKLNPWWRSKEEIETDKHLLELKRYRYINNPQLLNYDFKEGNLYTIRGPRQIGKTTFLKMLIKKKLDEYKKESIFYWSCDNLTSREDLIELLSEYSDICSMNKVSPRMVILDEITGIKEWQKSLKFVIDNNLIGTPCFILTGSNSFDLKKGSELLPGRRGKDGKDLFILPLSFREYVEMIDLDWFMEHRNDDLNRLRMENRHLRIHFERYTRTGGIPLVINEFESTNSIPEYLKELYYSWIIGDIQKEGKNEQSLKELMKSIIITYTTPVSWDSLAKRSSIRSHVTISSYIDVLWNIFVLIPCYYYNIHEKKIDHGKNKKIYFQDPFIMSIFSEKMNLNTDMSKVVEGIVASHLKRKSDHGEILYTQFKKETDFVDKLGNGIEVKYQNKIDKSHQINKSKLRDLVILSKDSFDEDVIPIHIFLFHSGPIGEI